MIVEISFTDYLDEVPENAEEDHLEWQRPCNHLPDIEEHEKNFEPVRALVIAGVYP